MRAELVSVVGAASALEGTAESLPLGDASVDGVFGAQMWHWTDPVKALPEIARVLRPGGRFAIVWNVRDTSVPWISALNEIVPLPGSQLWCEGNPSPAFSGPFSEVDHWEFRYERPASSPEDLLGLIGTLFARANQPVLRLPKYLAAFAELTRTHPDL